MCFLNLLEIETIDVTGDWWLRESGCSIANHEALIAVNASPYLYPQFSFLSIPTKTAAHNKRDPCISVYALGQKMLFSTNSQPTDHYRHVHRSLCAQLATHDIITKRIFCLIWITFENPSEMRPEEETFCKHFQTKFIEWKVLYSRQKLVPNGPIDNRNYNYTGVWLYILCACTICA